ncbi:hypothetical protein HXA34_01805 [Salipaludibacillus agaradhaerens]|jgi:hypothetical protein|uniref:glycosyl hydrolase family 28-related protein n=1 Tax=Salipaludibacillus agaradhaerens TaxID=76935 RepID=UPI0021517FDD|nr:glycosyl hydrolase family 28-related protein [Salipaludibacillus agaradhaerens]MCR6105019.1 hypothetical protein [Salipaludibacillus agaradhaerens]MCR6117064.1 hypothetical protein [Salipaludibacillus agaradhaerens]
MKRDIQIKVKKSGQWGELTPNSEGYNITLGGEYLDNIVDDIKSTTVSNTDNLEQIHNALENLQLPQEIDQEVWSSLEEVILNVKNFGASGNGVNDDSEAFQIALDKARDNNGGIVFVPPGEYVIMSTLHMYSNTHLKMSEGAILYFTEDVTTGISAVGEVVEQVNLTQTISPRNTAVYTSEYVPLSKGDLVFIGDERKPVSNQPMRGEFHFVKDAGETSLTLEEATFEEYSVLHGAMLQKINPVKNIRITGGNLIGVGQEFEQHQAVYLRYTMNCVIESVSVKDWYYRGIRPSGSLNGYIRHCHFEDIHSDSLGYGTVIESGTINWDISNNTYVRCGKAFDVGGHSYEYGTSRFIWFRHNHVYGSFRNAISTHEGGEYIYILYNDCFSRRHNVGIWLRTANTFVIGNNIFNAQQDSIRTENRGMLGKMVIEDNKCHTPSRVGINVSNFVASNSYYTGVYTSVSIKRNIIENAGQRGIYVKNEHGNYGPGSLLSNVMIHDNDIRVLNSGFEGIYIRGMSGHVRDGIIKGNHVRVNDTYSAILLRGDAPYDVSRFLVEGNYTSGGYGIRGVGNKSDNFIIGNFARYSITGISNFDSVDVGNNRSIQN